LRPSRRAHVDRLKFFYDVASIAAMQITMNYSVIPFMLMDLSPTIAAWRRLGWYGHWLCASRAPVPADDAGLVPLLAFSLGAGKPLRAHLKARDAAHLKRVEKQTAKETAREADKGLTIPPETADHAAQVVAEGLGATRDEKAL